MRPQVCRALGCDEDALTEFEDGTGRWFALCENHGDLLAVGFQVKPAR